MLAKTVTRGRSPTLYFDLDHATLGNHEPPTIASEFKIVRPVTTRRTIGKRGVLAADVRLDDLPIGLDDFRSRSSRDDERHECG
jgi:hypothetical protein